jgi:hypothetical protein
MLPTPTKERKPWWKPLAALARKSGRQMANGRVSLPGMRDDDQI